MFRASSEAKKTAAHPMSSGTCSRCMGTHSLTRLSNTSRGARPAKAGVLARIAARLAGIKIVVHTPHGHNFYGYFDPFFTKLVIWLERQMSRITDKIICLTELEKSDFLKFRVAPEEKLTVIYQGLELEKYRNTAVDKAVLKRSLGIRREDLVVGFIGRLEEIKGPEYFVRAAAKATSGDNITFLIIGEGNLRDKLKNLAEALGIAGKTVFTGWREDIPQILAAIDILVQPSLNEAVGIALLEAQAAGVPVVASRVGGVPEVVKDGFSGILVPAKDTDALAAAINLLSSQPQTRSAMATYASEWVKGRFSLDAMVEKTAGLYAILLEKDKR